MNPSDGHPPLSPPKLARTLVRWRLTVRRHEVLDDLDTLFARRVAEEGVRKARWRYTYEALNIGLFGIGDICVVGEGEPAPSLTLSVTPDGDGWRVQIDAQDFTFSKDFVDLYHVPGMGHGHLYVGGMKLGRLYAPEAYIGALPKGQHEIRVALTDVRAAPRDREMDLRRISALSLFLDRPKTKKTFFVDNFRLQ